MDGRVIEQQLLAHRRAPRGSDGDLGVERHPQPELAAGLEVREHRVAAADLDVALALDRRSGSRRSGPARWSSAAPASARPGRPAK